MKWILLAVILSCVVLTPGTSPTIYKARENENTTIRWDSSVRSDLTNSSILCVLLKSMKVLYRRRNGVESSGFLDPQFSERVQCDGDALREGRVVLRLSKVTAEDSGTYRCDLHAHYNEGRWETHVFENFLLNVTTASDEENHLVLSGGPTSAAGAEDPPAQRKPRSGVNDPTGAGIPLAVAALVVLILYGVYLMPKPRFIRNVFLHLLNL
ncbi:uncharacterized protein LOC105358245 [Oryzias latipes]|uniref:uncharacterized protein LOC105358245 n=1 Tax=Oryzias latipes TaxID=8090 RepID=UPI0005CC2351|nr:uncharacterized protein LOC105358245 [Oryzias latipes]XP_023821874.1 uncharacterized protein LOC105358245 [Oryzias latipes]